MGPAWGWRRDGARRRLARRVPPVKRAALRLSTAAILLVTAVACGDDDDSGAPPTTAPAVTPDTAGQYPPQPAGVPFPAADWPTASLPAGVDQAAIDDDVAAALGPADAGGRCSRSSSSTAASSCTSATTPAMDPTR